MERTYCHPQDVAKQQAANLMQDLLNNQNPCYVAFMKNRNRKAIPVVGGVLGGGITYLSFKPCCDKLKASLQNTILSNPDYQNSETEDAILAEFADVTTSGYEAVPGTV